MIVSIEIYIEPLVLSDLQINDIVHGLKLDSILCPQEGRRSIQQHRRLQSNREQFGGSEFRVHMIGSANLETMFFYVLNSQSACY